ncbi:MAG TPA: AraC family transcriptional regulator [Roseiflexaceae bacterium]|nr:AraC family transcriptional regulator [Roseiflexaceae bacterium]
MNSTSGILNPSAIATEFQLSRHSPAPDIGAFVERYWIVSWDRRGQAPHLQETLPFPSVHLVLERGNSRIVGVVKGKFSILLHDQGIVFGIKFRPGAYYPFVRAPVVQLTDRTIPLADVFGQDGAALEVAVCAQSDEAKMVEQAEQFLRGRLPEHDPQVELINRIVDCVVADRAIVTVDDLVARFSLTKRTLQRIFSQYVGVSPKWVIMRYRLQEAAEQMAGGEMTNWTKLALDLGYFDQAHFIKDFKTIVGQTPAEYARSLRRNL